MSDGHSVSGGAGTSQAGRPHMPQVESRLIFEREMGHTARAVHHDRTSVLLLGWCPAVDDTGATAELEELEEVFRDQYRFKTRKELLHLQSHPEPQAFQHLADFVVKEGSPRTLLIIYYAGHGWAQAPGSGRISLSGRLPCSTREEALSIEWINVEKIFANASADVLVVFDCCNAGLICRRATRGRNGCYQYLAACGETQTTHSAGDQSFTHAMIWALKELATGPSFPLTTLRTKIESCPTFPSHEQTPELFLSRFEDATEIIWLAPTPAAERIEADRPPSPPVSMSTSPSVRPADAQSTLDTLDLRFHFAKALTEDHIKDLAGALRRILAQGSAAHRISFVDHRSVLEAVVRRWKDKARRRTGGTNLLPVPLAGSQSLDASIADNTSQRLQFPRLDTAQDGFSTTLTSAVDAPDEDPGIQIVLGTNRVIHESSAKNVEAGSAKEELAVCDRLILAFNILFGHWRPHTVWHPSSWVRDTAF